MAIRWFRVMSVSPNSFLLGGAHVTAHPNSVLAVNADMDFPPPSLKHIFKELSSDSPVVQHLSRKINDDIKIAQFFPTQFRGIPFERPGAQPKPQISEPPKIKEETATAQPEPQVVDEPAPVEEPVTEEIAPATPKPSVDRTALSKMKKSKLLELAGELGVAADKSMTRKEIIAAILESSEG